MGTKDMADENFKKLQELFPNAVTETIVDGEVVRAIDKDVLQQEISSFVVDGPQERYQFTWPDKRNAVRLASEPINKTLRPCREESVDFDNTENLYIEGDNLDVLKLLQETYLGKVKMIYIDPPYNTGHDFVYNDSFDMSAEEYADVSGEFDEENNRLVQNTDSNGRFHTDWLNMLYPRLKVAKNLLSDDGVIFVSIDDNELTNLTKICDEVFGKKNFISNLVWQKKTGASDATHIATITENILVYSKNQQKLKLKQNASAYDPKRYKYRDEFFEERGPFYFDSLDRGTLGYHESLDYGVEAPDGTLIYPNKRKGQKNDGWRWKWSKEKLEWGLKNKFVEIRKNGEEWGVYYKIYLNVDNDGNKITKSSPFKNIIQGILNTHASNESKTIFGRTDLFSNPKPTDLISFLVDLSNDTEGTIIDFFSGSSTTAHAVMQLNAEDGGNRKFIMVQLPEETDEKSEAYKAGYKNICEIGKERIRRAGAKIKEEKGLDAVNLDTGFRVLKLDSSNMKDVYYNPDDLDFRRLDDLVDNIKDDRTPEDLLFQIMLELGVLPSSKIVETEIAGKKVFDVAENFLIACFDKDITEDVITEIAKKKPYYFVMRDASMATDSVATNFEQIFATYSPDTVRKVL